MGTSINSPITVRSIEQDAQDVGLTFSKHSDVISLWQDNNHIVIDGSQLIEIVETLVMKGCIEPPKLWRWEA